MAHFAKLDDDNTVLQVQVVDNPVLDPNNTGTEDESLGIAFLTNIHGWTNWKQTSYNNNFRKQYAGIGYIYDPTKDKFIVPKPFSSWSLDSNDDWKAPVDYPTVLEFGDPVQYHIAEWNETELRWDDSTTGKFWDPNTSSWVDS
jgi:hypothetical protein|tara:strand:+ start:1442 stop:1873 length:432 start_codon:yes stop_codon:yes gene_type:complete